MTLWPGSPWREYHVHDYGRYYKVINEVIHPFFESCRSPTFWHYIYHWAGGPHLRIRIGDSHGTGEELLARLKEFTETSDIDMPTLSPSDYEERARKLTAVEGLKAVPPQASRSVVEVPDTHYEPLIERFKDTAEGLQAFTASSRIALRRSAGWGSRVQVLTETLLLTSERFRISSDDIVKNYGELASRLNLKPRADRTVEHIVNTYAGSYTSTTFAHEYGECLPRDGAFRSDVRRSALRFWHLHLNRLGFSVDEECLVALSVAESVKRR